MYISSSVMYWSMCRMRLWARSRSQAGLVQRLQHAGEDLEVLEALRSRSVDLVSLLACHWPASKHTVTPGAIGKMGNLENIFSALKRYAI